MVTDSMHMGSRTHDQTMFRNGGTPSEAVDGALNR
jgi:hypothetical protein